MVYLFSQRSIWDTSDFHKNRLYAYPNKPTFKGETDGLVILDSGAYGLSKAGGSGVPRSSYKDISAHYAKYPEAFMFAPPDHFLDPVKTMDNWNFWHEKGLFSGISPVLQFKKKGELDDLSKQVDFYLKNSTPKKWFISNPGLWGKSFLGSLYFTDLIQSLKAAGIEWIHILGAGWNLQDVYDWAGTGVDSIDSVAWYNQCKTKDQAVALSLQYQAACDMLNSFR